MVDDTSPFRVLVYSETMRRRWASVSTYEVLHAERVKDSGAEEAVVALTRHEFDDARQHVGTGKAAVFQLRAWLKTHRDVA